MAVISQLLSGATNQLQDVSGTDSHREALLLLAFVTGRQTSSLLVNQDDEIGADDQDRFWRAVEQRQRHQPISQIVGARDFWNHSFIVTPDVLDPRPDTETLVEVALSRGNFANVLDLGTGSGCILLSLLDERPRAKGVGVDASDAALAVARQNATALGLVDRATFQIGDWCMGLSGKFDLVVSNPPYIKQTDMDTLSKQVLDWEPRMALTPEGDGLDAYRKIAQGVGGVMEPAADLVLEIGFDQAQEVCNILQSNGFQSIEVHPDINNKDRVVSAKTKA